MKLTHILCKQHIGRHFKAHWKVQGKKKIYATSAEEILLQKGVSVARAEDIESNWKQKEPFTAIGIAPKPIKYDHTHPNWHDRICHTYYDSNVLLEGLTQAKIITKTVQLHDGLPETLQFRPTSKEIDKKVKSIILNSHVFDAEQEKLPIVKDPLRPAWVFPRTYGITDVRRNTILILKLMQLIELLGDKQTVKDRLLLSDLKFSFPFEKLGNLIQFELRSDAMITASKPLSPVTLDVTDELKLPNLHPVSEMITLNKENIYQLRNLYPIKKHITKLHPHTVFVHYNPTEVHNIYEEEVTEHQVYGRSLLKTFTVAASYARLMFGDNVSNLPKPVTVQCVQTDGRLFHFGILQLNTLNLEGTDGTKNVWYQSEHVPLFDRCCYVNGKPILEGYNGNVMKHLLTFYHNI